MRKFKLSEYAKQYGITGVLFFVICFSSIYQVKASPAFNNAQKGSLQTTETIWRLQAQSVAASLGLAEDKSNKIIDIYLAARKSYKKTLKAQPDEVDKEKYSAIIVKIRIKERTNLETALHEFLTKEQSAIAIQSLGSFNPRWDRYVKTLMSFELDKEKMVATLKLVNTYISDYQEARDEVAATGDRLSSVTARNLKETLDSGLAKLLNESQLEKWKEATAFGKKKK